MKKVAKKLTTLLLVMILACSMMACGGKDQAEGTTEGGQSVVSGETVYPYDYVSKTGTKVTIEAEPQTIISVSPAITELLYKLELGDRLIGRSDYCNYPAEAASVESIGSLQTPDIERIIGKNPDLVIASDIVDEQITDKLASVGVPVILVKDVGNIEEVYSMMTDIGAVLNCNDKMAACINEMKTTISEVEEKVKGLPAPSVYYVVSYGEYGDATAGGDTFMHDIITTAGGDNIGKDISGWSINLEEIIEKDPDIIILPPYYDGAFQETAHYKDLTAVKEGRVYVIDSDTCDRQGYRNAEAVRTLAEIFHPEAFK